MTVERRHEPTVDCSGIPRPTIILGPGTRPFGTAVCADCGRHLCPCEETYGHDCEEPS